MSEYQIKNTFRYLIILGFSTLLIVSFQNCQGVDSQLVLQSLEAPNGSGGNPGTEEPPVGEEPPVEELPPIVPPEACDLGNEKPSWVETSINNAESGKAVFLSAIDEMSGAKFISSVSLKAKAGPKGKDLEESDILAAGECNTKRISGSQNINVDCNLNGDRLTVSVDNANNNECVEGEFEVTARVIDSCGESISHKFIVVSKNICLPQKLHSHDDLQESQKPGQGAYYSFDMQKSGNLVAINSPGDSEKFNVGGAVSIYSYNGDGSLNFRDKILPSDSRSDQYNVFSIDGDYVAIGSPSLGKVKVYQYSGGSYALIKTLSFNYSNFYSFGKAIGFIDGMLAVGSPGEKSVYLYSLPSVNQVKKISHANTQFGDNIASIKYNGGDYLAIRSLNANKGQIHFARWNGSELIVKPLVTGSSDGAGKVLKANHEFVFVGDTNSSKAQVISLSEFIKAESGTAKVALSLSNPGTRLGSSFASDNNYVYVGAPREEEGEGVVYVYKKSNGDEVRWIRPRSQNRPANQEFGRSMIMDSGRLYIGAPYYSSQTETLKGRLFYVDMQ